MAKYDKSKFYWLQLKEDFFDEDAIDWLEEQPNGKEYVLFYLKLCLKSLKTDGILVRQVGDMLVPYDYNKLAELTKTKPDTVIVAMELLIKIGLVQKLENGELYISQVENMIGSQSKSAFKKQQQLTKRKENEAIEAPKNNAGWSKGGQRVEKIPPKIKIEIKDKDKDRNILNNNTKLKDTTSNIVKDIVHLEPNSFSISDEIESIFSLWNECKITVHRVLTEEIQKAIQKALSIYGLDSIVEGIKHYMIVFKDKNYFFSYKWNLMEFLKQSNALPTFLENGDKWQNYINSKEGKKTREFNLLDANAREMVKDFTGIDLGGSQ